LPTFCQGYVTGSEVEELMRRGIEDLVWINTKMLFNKSKVSTQKNPTKSKTGQAENQGSGPKQAGSDTTDGTTEKRQQSSNRQGKEWHNI